MNRPKSERARKEERHRRWRDEDAPNDVRVDRIAKRFEGKKRQRRYLKQSKNAMAQRKRKKEKEKGPDFSKGPGGRERGIPNKVTRILKEASVLAAEDVGDLDERAPGASRGRDGVQGYFRWCARHEPAAFLAFLAKVMPLQIVSKHHEVQEVIQYSPADALNELQRRGIKLPTLFAPLQLEQAKEQIEDAEFAEVSDEEEE